MKKLNKKQIIIICTLAFGVPALTVCTIFGVKHVTNRVNEYQQPFKEYYDKKCAEFIEQNKTIKKNSSLLYRRFSYRWM